MEMFLVIPRERERERERERVREINVHVIAYLLVFSLVESTCG